MRLLLGLLTLCLMLGSSAVASEYHLSREWLGGFLIVVALGFLATIVHESGHAIAAWRVGFEVRRIAVVPIEFDLMTRRLAWAKTPGSDIAGYVDVVPHERATSRDAIWVALGGPLAEALLATVLFALLTISSPSTTPVQLVPIDANSGIDEPSHAERLPPSFEGVVETLEAQRRVEVLRGLSTMLAVLGIGSAVINLLPIGGSDGEQILRSLRASRRRNQKL